MWIVSQKKNLVVNSNKIISFINNGSSILAVSNPETERDCGFYNIGSYSDEKIQEVFKRLTDAIIHPMNYDNKFEMPEE